jgi:hypothetical protein
MERPAPRRRADLVIERVGDELAIYDRERHTAHWLSAGAAGAWELCDGRRSATEIAVALGIGHDEVVQAIDQLEEAALLEAAPVLRTGMTRRQAAKRFAQLGVAAVGAPLLYSVAVPSAAAASSGDLCAGVVCNDDNACTVDSCDPSTGLCVFTPKDCNDENACTTDSCDAVTGNCRNTPISCDDGDACTMDTCDAVLGCQHTAISCDDGDACTVDSCEPASGCVHTPISCSNDGDCPSGCSTCLSGICATSG